MKILIIDDSNLMLNLANEILSDNLQDVMIETFQNPINALNRIKSTKVDLVITDLIMKELSGIDILRMIKSSKKLKYIKVLVVTSITDYDILTECYELGASDYILKPFNKSELVSRVKNVLKEINMQNKLEKQLENINFQHKKLSEANEKLKITQSTLIQGEQLAGIGQLAAGIAHEINNPLGFSISNLDTLSEYIKFILELMNKYEKLNIESDDINKFKIENDYDFLKDDFSELIDDTKSGLSRVKEIVKSLRSFSRVDDSDEFLDFNVNEGVKESLVITKNEYKYTSDIETKFGEISVIDAHGGEINQVLLNLIINSVHAIKEKNEREKEKGNKINRGKIIIETYEESDFVIIKLSDNGCGMEEKSLSKIFNPFYTTKPIGSGTGLGLSITYDIIVNKHKGKIEVESTLDVGTIFTLYLPISQIRVEE
ncbi:response regulator [Clostridiaceae bacterium HSG29]|nr:response regulator [Clostridiaceae bacterium HSG29]